MNTTARDVTHQIRHPKQDLKGFQNSGRPATERGFEIPPDVFKAIDLLDAAVVDCDENGALRRVNSAAESLFGAETVTVEIGEYVFERKAMNVVVENLPDIHGYAAACDRETHRHRIHRQFSRGNDGHGAADGRVTGDVIYSTVYHNQGFSTRMERMNTILLVEDDLDTQEMMRSMLQREYRLVCAINSRQTLEALEQSRVDLILMDLSLHRNESGLTLTKYLREHESYREIPIIALTAHAFSSDKHKCLEAGCNEYLPKPFRVKELRELLHRFAKSNGSTGTTALKGDARPAPAP